MGSALVRGAWASVGSLGKRCDVAGDADQLLDLVVVRGDLGVVEGPVGDVAPPRPAPASESFLKSMSQNLGVFASQCTVPPPTVWGRFCTAPMIGGACGEER